MSGKEPGWWPEERAIFKPPTKAEMQRIDGISKKWDDSPELQAKYNGNFYMYLADELENSR